MRESHWRRRAIPTIVAAAAIVIGLSIWSPFRTAPVEPSPPARAVTIEEICHLPVTAGKGPTETAANWQLAVRQDSAAGTAAFFTSGTADLVCDAARGSDGGFVGATIAEGGYTPADGRTLTWDTGSSGAGSDLVIGQMPRGTATIEVVTSDGERRMATLGSAFYLAYATTGPSPDGPRVVEIVARDASGAVLARLADPAGLHAGASSGTLAAK